MNRDELLELIKPLVHQINKVDYELNQCKVIFGEVEKSILRIGKEPIEVETIKGKEIEWADIDNSK